MYSIIFDEYNDFNIMHILYNSTYEYFSENNSYGIIWFHDAEYF